MLQFHEKEFSCTIFDKKIDMKRSERKSWELTVCNTVHNYTLVFSHIFFSKIKD